jgi:hypothetical protein
MQQGELTFSTFSALSKGFTPHIGKANIKSLREFVWSRNGKSTVARSWPVLAP